MACSSARSRVGAGGWWNSCRLWAVTRSASAVASSVVVQAPIRSVRIPVCGSKYRARCGPGALLKAVAGAGAPNQLLDLEPTGGETIQLRLGRCGDVKPFHGRTVHHGAHLSCPVYLESRRQNVLLSHGTSPINVSRRAMHNCLPLPHSFCVLRRSKKMQEC